MRNPTTGPAAHDEIDGLLKLMRGGDREAAAAFVTRYGRRIRRRVRGKLSPTMRRIFDSQDILSTVGRRLDVYVKSGRLEAASKNQLWALINKMASNAIVDKSRVIKRLERVEDEDGPFAYEFLGRLREAEREDAEELEIERAICLLDDKIDRQILYMWLSDTSHTVIAELVDLAPTAVRKRWQSIKKRLHEHFAARPGG